MADITAPLPMPEGTRQVEQDLGFGSVVSSQGNYRLLNQDGSFNVRVIHGSLLDRILSYHTMLTISWPKFFAVAALVYLILNTLFAFLYMSVGTNELRGDLAAGPFLRAFFFSVHTFATVGYGSISPVGVGANIIVTLETLVGLGIFALFTGIVFSRFSRPVPAIRYSKNALIAPYRDITAFEFRVVNERKNQLTNVVAVVMMSRFETRDGIGQRHFYQLDLERGGVAFFPLNWTVVHPINPSSPLYGWTREMLLASEAEFDILLTAVDETFAQTVQSRASYTASEVMFGRKFSMMYQRENGTFILDLSKLDATEYAETPANR